MGHRSMVWGFTCASVTALVLGCGTEQEKAIGKYRDATAAIASGDKDRAMELLDDSIRIQPTSYAYYQRARIHVERGDADAAVADCEKGLELAPNDRDLRWLLAECKKEPAKRFQGKNKNPPSALK